MGEKAHSEPALQEVYEWRKKLWKGIEGKPLKEQADYINEKSKKIWADFGKVKTKAHIG